MRASVRRQKRKKGCVREVLLRRCHQAPRTCFTSDFFSKMEASLLHVLIMSNNIYKILIIQKYRQMTVEIKICL